MIRRDLAGNRALDYRLAADLRHFHRARRQRSGCGQHESELDDRGGKVLYQNPAYLFREQYEVSQDLSSFFEEDSPAFRRLSQDFARTLVANILEGF